MLFKKNFALLVLAMTLSGSVKANVLLDGVKYSGIAAAAYAGAEGVMNSLCANKFSPDMQATISAAVAVACVSGLSQYDKKEKANEKFSPLKDGKSALAQAAKPFVLLGMLKFGMPALNWLFTHFVRIDKMVTKNQISAIDAQKLVLAYITAAKVLDIV